MNFEEQIKCRDDIESGKTSDDELLYKFFECGLGVLEVELCKFIGCTPKQLATLRKEDSDGIVFIEKYILWDYKQRNEVISKYNKSVKKLKESQKKLRGSIDGEREDIGSKCSR